MAVGSGRAYDRLFKILLVGNSGVGKSSFLLRFVGEEFDDQQLSTIGVDFRVKFVNAKNKVVKLAIWDTAGQERFRTLTSSYYKGAHGIVLMYDVSDRESFDAVHTWLSEVNKHCGSHNCVIVLIANKIDKRKSQDCVSTQEGQDLAIQYSMLFVETSAKTSEGVDIAFKELVQKILESTRPEEAKTALRLEDEKGSEGGLGVCGC